eukprot:1190134-Prorocentrum_minimum.AAC.3
MASASGVSGVGVEWAERLAHRVRDGGGGRDASAAAAGTSGAHQHAGGAEGPQPARRLRPLRPRLGQHPLALRALRRGYLARPRAHAQEGKRTLPRREISGGRIVEGASLRQLQAVGSSGECCFVGGALQLGIEMADCGKRRHLDATAVVPQKKSEGRRGRA